MRSKFTDRHIQILSRMQIHQSYTLDQIATLLSSAPSLPTLRRDVFALCSDGLLGKEGTLKSSRYALTARGIIESPIEAQKYCSEDVDRRGGERDFQFGIFSQLSESQIFFSEVQRLNEKTKEYQAKSVEVSEVLRNKELERFVIELSWKSSKIEGNTYTLLDTERLLRDAYEAPGHTREEARMIINHKHAFEYIMSDVNQYREVSLKHIEEIHQLLVKDLGVDSGIRHKPVGITGSCYVPLSINSQIREAVTALCHAINNASCPFAKAFIALIGCSYVQPFEDGNKRTARLLCNALLMAHQCAPLSYRSVHEVGFREAMLVFYERNSIVSMQGIFIEQYLFACENYLAFYRG